MTPEEKYPSLSKHLKLIENIQKRMLLVGKEVYESFEGNIYLPHFVLLTSLNRTSNINDAILDAIKKWNFTAAGALLRMQLETLYTLIYIAHSNIPQQAEFYFREGKLKKFEIVGDRVTPKTIRDGELVAFATKSFPWIATVYKETSRLVHFSDKHIYAMTTKIDEKEHKVQWKVGVGNENWPEKAIEEMLIAVTMISTEILNHTQMIAKKFKEGLEQIAKTKLPG